MIEVNRNPSPREVRIFGLLWLLFFGAVGVLVLWKPEALVGAAAFLGLAWIVSLTFNSAERRLQLLGGLIPLLFAAFGSGAHLGSSAWGAAYAAWGLAAAGALGIWVFPGFGRRAYVVWMLAATPVGWTISHVVLGIVYYLVLTPIGLVMRWAGRDPMSRRFDKSARSYWIERKTEIDPARYFKQF